MLNEYERESSTIIIETIQDSNGSYRQMTEEELEKELKKQHREKMSESWAIIFKEMIRHSRTR